MSRILLGVSGGIAAYKACELTRLLVKAGHDVIPLVTSGAQRFVTEETFLALARRPKNEDVYPHLTRADLLVVAPCTANTLAKLAQGIADNVLTEAALAHRGPVLVAPAMNPRMWSNAATRANVETIRARGIELVGPDEGEMAEGEWGVGRLAEPVEIVARAEQLLAPGPLELAPTPDIARTLGQRKHPGQVIVAFGAEHGEDGLARKRTMLETKNADLVVFNDIGRPGTGFDSLENEVVLVTDGGERRIAR